jgi:LacI family transcriptional regulator
MGVTINDIAKKANVSRGTVDKILHNRPGVSDEIRANVMRIASELGYKPNVVGKALSHQKKPHKIGVIFPANSVFFEQLQNGIDAAHREYEDYGLVIECRAMVPLLPSEQLRLMDSMRREVSGLALVPINHATVGEKIDELVDQGMPVVTFNNDIRSSKRLCFIGQDAISAGKTAGELMGKTLGGQGKVIIMTGHVDMLHLNERTEGFISLIKEEFPGMELDSIRAPYGAEGQLRRPMVSYFEKDKDVRGVFVPDGGIAGMIGRIISEAGRKDIKVIVFDLLGDTKDLIIEGVIDFAIDQNPFEQGYRAIKVLFDYIYAKKEPEQEYQYTDISVKMKYNL